MEANRLNFMTPVRQTAMIMLEVCQTIHASGDDKYKKSLQINFSREQVSDALGRARIENKAANSAPVSAREAAEIRASLKDRAKSMRIVGMKVDHGASSAPYEVVATINDILTATDHRGTAGTFFLPPGATNVHTRELLPHAASSESDQIFRLYGNTSREGLISGEINGQKLVNMVLNHRGVGGGTVADVSVVHPAVFRLVMTAEDEERDYFDLVDRAGKDYANENFKYTYMNTMQIDGLFDPLRMVYSIPHDMFLRLCNDIANEVMPQLGAVAVGDVKVVFQRPVSDNVLAADEKGFILPDGSREKDCFKDTLSTARHNNSVPVFGDFQANTSNPVGALTGSKANLSFNARFQLELAVDVLSLVEKTEVLGDLNDKEEARNLVKRIHAQVSGLADHDHDHDELYSQ